MFRTMAIVALTLTVLAAAGHYLVFGPRPVSAGVAAPPLRRWSAWQRCLHGLITLSFIVLAATGFGPAIRGEPLEGWWLLVHILSGPVFAAGVTILALTWAEQCRVAPYDLEWLRYGGGYLGTTAVLCADKFDAGQKTFFWTIVTLSFLALGSVMLATLPLFGQETLGILCTIHRYSALGLFVVLILHIYATILAKRGTWRAMVSGFVDAEWARQHHPLWFAQMSMKGQ